MTLQDALGFETLAASVYAGLIVVAALAPGGFLAAFIRDWIELSRTFVDAILLFASIPRHIDLPFSNRVLHVKAHSHSRSSFSSQST